MKELPLNILQFLEGATYGVAGTRTGTMEPHVHALSGWKFQAESGLLACFFADAHAHQLLESLEENGDIAVTIVEMPSHETYQIKGKFVESRECTAGDFEDFKSYREAYVAKATQKWGVPDEMARKTIFEPRLTVFFQPVTVFDQSPGPLAGAEVKMGGV